MVKTKDDKVRVIKDDIERMRTRPSVFIGYLGEAGVLHLCHEIIDNNRDECLKKESTGDTINIDITEDMLITSDNGRGIPTDMLRVIHETMNAGSNMTRDHGSTAGENGIGTTTYTALSSYLQVTTLRPQEKKKMTITYKEGELIDEKVKPYKGQEHGLQTIFKPSKKVLGTDKIPIDRLVEWIRGFEYLLPRNIKMNYNVNGEPNKINHKELYEYFDETVGENRLCEALSFKCDGHLEEIVREVKYDRTFRIEAAVIYSSKEYRGEEIRKSWMNMIYTSNNGMHVNGVINGLSKILIEKVLSKKKSLEGEDLKKDVLSNLQVVVKAECDCANIFNSQEKSYVFPKPLLYAITNSVYKALADMPDYKIDDLVDIVIQNNRVRREGEKARNLSSTTKAFKSWSKPTSYIPHSSVKTKEPKELYLVEGVSAGGGIREARDPRFQAILQFRGKTLNVWDETLERVLKSEVWLNLVKVLGCGIGPTFDINKLNFDKIILCTDADIDGYHIRVNWCAFFLKFMPEIIESGRLFIAEPPLYQLTSGKKVSYVATQIEYIHNCIDSIGDIQISFPTAA